MTDKFIETSDILPKILKPLDAEGIEYVIYSDVAPNPTCKNVTDGVRTLQENKCDFIISVGGGSPQDYEGLHKSTKKGLPVVAIKTIVGTSAEITINYVITDEERKVKMVMVDKNSLALISVNDPELMLSKPKDLTAATGMDALTHAVEALGLHIEGKTDEECASYAITEIEKLSETVGIPKKLTELGIEEKEFDFEYLSKNALIDACAPGNPFMPTLEETIAFYKELF